MTWTGLQRAVLAAIVLAGACTVSLTAEVLEPIAANDNRTPAGELRGDVLTLRLELRKGNWHPEAENGQAISVYAFSETGKQLQVPGPTVRVHQGATIDVTVHNTLPVAATLHGLHQRPGDDNDVVTVAAGGTQHVRFVAGVPGTYLYYAQTPDGRRGNARVLDSMLGGALVVDPPGVTANDRIFVLERWNGPTRTAINGKSWPFTERLNYAVGENVHWRVINASDLSHPMHLHGSFFTLDAEGDGEHYTEIAANAKPQEFTQNVEIGQVFDMSWVPKEPGRWLYHCHRLPHMRLPVDLDPADIAEPGIGVSAVTEDHEHMHGDDSEYDGMGGMIMGITITGKSSISTSENWKAERNLELTVGSRNDDPRFYQLSLKDLAPAAAKARPQVGNALAGPPMILTQNQPVEITIVNKLKESTSIHWHGIELESYYDGVPEYGGLDDKRSPAIEPGQTFTVKMTPPKAGTFMYHTHWHDAAQLTGGVHGALIIMPPGQTYDPATDKPFIFSQSPNEPFGAAMILMNGTPQPNTMQLRTGTKYRFRLMNITPSQNNLQVSLRNSGSPVQWRLIAKDAVDATVGMVRTADQMIAVGETYDFEYTATSAQQLTLEGIQPGDTRRTVQTLVFTDAAR